MADKKRLDAVLAKMASTPLFYLFGASKELFHSNFLLWISIVNPRTFLNLLCPSFAYSEDMKVRREWNASDGDAKAKLDFHITTANDDVLVVENKVKDYPVEEQLERIQAAVGSHHSSRFVLLTLFIEQGISFRNWEILTYRDLSERLDPGRFADQKYYRQLIADYKDFTFQLSEFADILEPTNDYDFAKDHDPNLYAKMDSYKLWESYQKVRASHMLTAYKRNYSVRGVETTSSLNNKSATIDFYIEIKKGVRVGIQIENGQYRRFVRSENAAALIESMKRAGIFFSNKFLSSRQLPYLNYGKTFKYQHEVMQGPIAFKLMFQSINEELSEIIKSREQIAELT